ncbi:hypothetical protein DACRYDRAFT_18615 [Dacryopinax primogenitus]|uniref:Uncharacterized protein n=1 Tax=Dacryopinax primogenitus (strain DJM 731) TaxID=1858805 RepID=M5FRN0_DACPD|nr:uncharacterized protein DACRYDRAFT_18615 [Dacryopinax primogenitus]EJT97659.1 hypothetical protein DACRYDRAFT_18615 [Dacryopinax primogenitus]
MSALALTDQALAANKDHQQDILDFAKECEARLKAVESLLSAADRWQSDVEKLDVQKQKWQAEEGTADFSDEENKGEEIVVVEGAMLAVGPTRWANLRAQDSPFKDSFKKVDEYHALTTFRPWSSKERDGLRIALQTELRRSTILAAQARGEGAISALKSFDPEAELKAVKGDEIKWDNVARILKGENLVQPPRTGVECRIQWMGVQHPEIDHSEWGEREKNALVNEVRERVAQREAEGDDGGLPWEQILILHNKMFKTRRTVAQCLRVYRDIMVNGLREFWSADEDDRLADAVARFNSNWVQIAKFVGSGRSGTQARTRWNRLTLECKRGRWTSEEDQALMQAVAEQQKQPNFPESTIDWGAISEKAQGRTKSQCRLRWATILQEELRNVDKPWTEEETAKLLKAKEQDKLTLKEVASRLPGRTFEVIAERYFAIVQERKAACDRKLAAAAPQLYTVPIPSHSAQIREAAGQNPAQDDVNVTVPIVGTAEDRPNESSGLLRTVNELGAEASVQQHDRPIPAKRKPGRPRRLVPTKVVPEQNMQEDRPLTLKSAALPTDTSDAPQATADVPLSKIPESATPDRDAVVPPPKESPLQIGETAPGKAADAIVFKLEEDNIAARVRGRRRACIQSPASSIETPHGRKRKVLEAEEPSITSTAERPKRGRKRK